MTNEQNLLIRLINGAIKNQKVEYSSDSVDVKKLLTMAKRHSVLNTIYPVLNESEKQLASRVYAAYVNQHALLDYYGGLIYQKFEENGICYMPLKGAILKQLYPDPLLRSSCDLDIFYKQEDTEKVNKALADLGFDFISDSHNHMVHQINGMVTIEMHHHLFSHNKDMVDYYADNIWKRLIKVSDYRYDFTDEDFYLFLLLHMHKHFTSSGFGVRSLLDVYIYNQHKSLDKIHLDKIYNKLGVTKFVHAIEKLADFWFNDGGSDELTLKLQSHIFDSGVYGTVKNSTLIQINKTNKFKYFFSRAFPPFSDMKKLYPSLQKCVLHLPFTYIHRLITALFSKKHKEKARLELKNMTSTPNNESAKLDKLYRELEIYK